MESRSIRTRNVCAFTIALVASLLLATNACAAVVIINVNSVADEIDDDTSDGVCHAMPSNACTLRAAIMTANRILGDGATINLPAGIYIQSRPKGATDGEDGGDLNLTTPSSGNPLITISGAGAANTIIDANLQDRVLDISAGRSATISGVTLRNGSTPNVGGGIRCLGSLSLSHVTLSDNTSTTEGGGIYLATSLTLNDSTLSGNKAAGGGGIYAVSSVISFVVNNSTLSTNTATQSNGGGIHTEASLALNYSTLSGNTAATFGGGIYAASPSLLLAVNTGVFNANTATLNDGGGIYITNAATLSLGFSTMSGNKAGGSGGAIYGNAGSTLTLDASTLSGNSATNGGGIRFESSGTLAVNFSTLSGNNKADSSGGGIFLDGSLMLNYSTLSGNTADIGGGLAINSGTANVGQSTFSGNAARLGGGIDNQANLFVTNSTISSNNADADGGGIRNISAANVYNSTIVGNQVDADINLTGTGGGFFNSSTFSLRNSVVAGNYSSGLPSFLDDCSGVVNTYGRNKYSVAGGGSTCTIVQHAPGSDTLVASLGELGPLKDNGGPTHTHALVPPSNMIDGAESTVGCIGKDNILLTTDQRGAPRIAGVRCDIGAFEYEEIIFANGFDLD